MEKSWLNKYKPKTIDNVVGHKDKIKELDKWVCKFTGNKKAYTTNSVIISGIHGIGKTLIINLILDKYNFEPVYITSSNIKEDKFLERYLIDETSLNINQIIEQKRKALIITDTENITLTKEKKMLISLCKTNEQRRIIPIIFVTNEQHSKLITDIKKISYEINFVHPSMEEINEFFKKICAAEKINITDDKIINNVIKYVHYDIRNLLYFLQNIHDVYGTQKISYDDCKNFLKFSQQKDKKVKLFDSTKILMNNYKSINKSLNLYEQNKVILPLMVYENYIINLQNRQCSTDNFYDSCSKISNSISKGDVVETNIYTDQNWYLQNFYGFYTCCETTFELSKYPLKFQDYKIEFSNDLNTTSIKNINKKNINKINETFNKNLSDILILNKLMNKLIMNKKLLKMKKIFEIYNIEHTEFIKLISIILKIDKTVDKTEITNKMKKILLQ